MEAKSGGRAPRARTSSSAGWTGSSPGKAFADGNTKSNLGSGSKGSAGSGGGVTGWQDGSGIGSGLARPDMDGCVLRRSSWSAIARNESPGGTGAGNTKLSELIPRFLRLSALVAIELGSEARDEEGGVDKLPYVVSKIPAAGIYVTDTLVPASSLVVAYGASPIQCCAREDEAARQRSPTITCMVQAPSWAPYACCAGGLSDRWMAWHRRSGMSDDSGARNG